MAEEKVENDKIEKRLTTLEVLMKDTREDVGEIRKQVFNEIPHQIDKIRTDFSDFKLSNKSWLIGILITLIFLLVGTLVSLIK